MEIKHAQVSSIRTAYDKVNIRYDYNVTTHDGINETRDGWRLQLKVVNARGTGGRATINGQWRGHACWHMVGDFLDELFRLEPNAVVRTALDSKITSGTPWTHREDLANRCKCTDRPTGRVDRTPEDDDRGLTKAQMTAATDMGTRAVSGVH